MGDGEIPAASVADVLACSFTQWAADFKAHAIRAVVVPLPVEFVEYLKEDGVVLPDDSAAMLKRGDTGGDEAPWSDEEGEGDVQVPEFAELKQSIKEAIAKLDGEVVPKLNWSSPKDAVWVSSTGSMKCTNPEEVFLLLKSSDAIIHDLEHVFDNCSDAPSDTAAMMPQPVLILKKWYDLHPSSEFRCFVRDGEFLGACQRDTANKYTFLSEMKAELEDSLVDFFEQHVAETFPRKSFTYDVHVTQSHKVKLLDFNPYGGETLPLLFDWHELEEMARRATHAAKAAARLMRGEVDTEAARAAASVAATEEASAPSSSGGAPGVLEEVEFEPELRLVLTQQQIRPGLKTGVPLDLYDSSDTGALADFFNKCKAERDNPPEDDS